MIFQDSKLILSWFWTDFKWFLNHYWFIFLIFQDFQAPHQQISGKIEKSAGSKLHSAFWANIHENDEWRLDPDDLPIFGDFRRLPIGKFPEKSGKSTGYNFKSACWKHVETCCQHVENNVENMLKICWKRVEKCLKILKIVETMLFSRWSSRGAPEHVKATCREASRNSARHNASLKFF